MNSFQIQSLPDRQLQCWQSTQAGQRLRVLSGRLWLTQSGDAFDHFPEAGDVVVLMGQRVVIEAQSDARYVMEAPLTAAGTDGSALLRRSLRVLQRLSSGLSSTWRHKRRGPA